MIMKSLEGQSIIHIYLVTYWEELVLIPIEICYIPLTLSVTKQTSEESSSLLVFPVGKEAASSKAYWRSRPTRQEAIAPLAKNLSQDAEENQMGEYAREILLWVSQESSSQAYQP